MENGHPFSIFHFSSQMENGKWKMGVHSPFFFIFHMGWKIKMTVGCTRTLLPVPHDGCIYMCRYARRLNQLLVRYIFNNPHIH